MRDWNQVVRQELAGLAIDHGETAQVFEELAGHLEENYRRLLSEGLAEEEAARRALARVGDWHDLKRSIEFARNKEAIMNKRVTQFWFPAFMTLSLSMVLLAVIQIFGPNPWTSAAGGPSWGALRNPGFRIRMMPVAVVYFSWLMALPFIGALGAYLSKRAGGRRHIVLSSVVFPVFPYVAFFVIGLPLALILDDHVAHNITIPALFVGLSAWVIFPALALLAGGLPVQYFSSRRLSASQVSGS